MVRTVPGDSTCELLGGVLVDGPSHYVLDTMGGQMDRVAQAHHPEMQIKPVPR